MSCYKNIFLSIPILTKRVQCFSNNCIPVLKYDSEKSIRLSFKSAFDRLITAILQNVCSYNICKLNTIHTLLGDSIISAMSSSLNKCSFNTAWNLFQWYFELLYSMDVYGGGNPIQILYGHVLIRVPTYKLALNSKRYIT